MWAARYEVDEMVGGWGAAAAVKEGRKEGRKEGSARLLLDCTSCSQRIQGIVVFGVHP